MKIKATYKDNKQHKVTERIINEDLLSYSVLVKFGKGSCNGDTFAGES